MSVILDHLGAVLVGSVVLLIIFAAQHETTSTAREETQYSANRELARAFAVTLHEDLLNVGAGVPAGEAAIASIGADSVVIRRTLGFNSTDVHDIVYRRQQAGWAIVEQDSIPIYSVSRLVDGVVELTSPGVISEFAVELRDANNAPTTLPTNARTIHVRMELGDIDSRTGEMLHRARISRTIAPTNI